MFSFKSQKNSPSMGGYIIKVTLNDDKTGQDETFLLEYKSEPNADSLQRDIDDLVKSTNETRYPVIIDYYTVMQQVLDGNIGPGTYEAVRKALKDIGGESVQLDQIQMDVTYPTVTNPEDVEAAIRTRIDSELGTGKFQYVKAVLKSMGIGTVTIERKSSISI